MFVCPGRRLSLACFSLFAFAGVASAQTKVAVVSLQRAVLDSAEIKQASAQMEAKYKPRQAELEKLQKEMEAISQKLQAGAGKLTPQAEADLNAEGTRKQREFQRKGEDLQGEVDRERQEILQGSSRKMGDIVRKVAEEKGFDLVIDVSNALFSKPALDITDAVLAAYNQAYPGQPAK